MRTRLIHPDHGMRRAKERSQRRHLPDLIVNSAFGHGARSSAADVTETMAVDLAAQLEEEPAGSP